MNSSLKFGALLCAMSVVGVASAFDLGADYTFLLSKGVDYSTNRGSWTGNHSSTTAVIHGNRSAGAAGGTTNLLPYAPFEFDAYCAELGQTIGGGYSKHQTVVPLLGAATTPGVTTGQVVFDANRTKNLELLWANFKSQATDLNHSAAFQLAQWELCYDDDVTLDENSTAKFWSNSNNTYRNIAEGWLSQIKNSTVTNRLNLVLLSDDGNQDQITTLVPEPLSVIGLSIGFAALLRRRNKKS